jgi:membrane-associated phospholipid phosphatase
MVLRPTLRSACGRGRLPADRAVPGPHAMVSGPRRGGGGNPRQMKDHLGKATRLLLSLRIEEVLALALLLPSSYLTFLANRYAVEHGFLTPRYSGGVLRLAIAVGALAILGLAHRFWPRSHWYRGLRQVLPFVACLLIYTNLHDTIGFVNPHDVQAILDALDRMIFGVQPCLWAERFISPGRTEVMAFFYGNFFWIAPAVPLLLLLLRRWREFRIATLGIVICFYMGYALYVVFPAAPPRLHLAHQFHVTLRGYPNLLFSFSEKALALLPADSRAAFPSLHAAVSLLALVYAWRYVRLAFWLLLPFVLGLWLSTVYLRHHYVVDLVAGWLLAPLALWLAPRLERWWLRLGGRAAPEAL